MDNFARVQPANRWAKLHVIFGYEFTLPKNVINKKSFAEPKFRAVGKSFFGVLSRNPALFHEPSLRKLTLA
jgi:hypothetical protein